MPIIKSAKAKLKKDKKKTKVNDTYRESYKKAIKAVKNRKPGADVSALIKKAHAAIDKAVKQNVIPKNRGNRLKAQVSRLTKKK